MYAKSISMYYFKCFGKAEVDFLYPGAPGDEELKHPNINLILGDNGGGKSSVLRAVAIAALAPALINGGFVPYRLVQRLPDGSVAKNSLLKLIGVLEQAEQQSIDRERKTTKSAKSRSVRPNDEREFLARLTANPRGQLDQLSLKSTPQNPISDLIHDDFSSAFFVVGYGATRRVETSSFSPSSEDKRRGRRYQRVASMFEDHVALRPMQTWFPRLDDPTKGAVVQLLKKALPDNVSFKGHFEDDEFIYEFDGVSMPFPGLSDGYKAFIGWVTDLIGHMVSVSQGQSIHDLSGIVLVDEIDLHLHPSWQRDVIARLSKAFPRFQFVMTSHSPLVAASVQSANVIVTGTGPDGQPALERMKESLYGRSVEAVLMSPYFGLDSARPYEARRATQALAAKVEETPGGDINAAEDFLRQLAQPIEGLIKGTSGARNRS